MPLTQQHRTNIHKKLSPIIGEEETNALLDTHPSPNEDTVTKDFLRAEIADLRTDMVQKLGTVETNLERSLRKHTLALIPILIAALAIVSRIT